MRARTRALLLNLGAIVCWSIPPLAIRYLKDSYSALLQTASRYLVSLVVLWAFNLAGRARATARADLRAITRLWPRLLLVALANYAFQVSFTYGFYLLYPGVGTLIHQSSVLFSVTLAAALFADERAMLRTAGFLLGLAAAISGVFLTIVGGPRFGTLEFGLGVMLMLVSAASWALLGALIRKWLGGISAAFAVSTILTVVTPLFFLTLALAEGGVHLPAARPDVWAVLAISGLIGVGLGHSLYYRAMPVLGLAVSSSLSLLIPLLVGVASYLVFGERLTRLQLLGGAVLLGGSYQVIRARFRTTR
jgi:O-acetylserine/cysteine efflux transporter